MPGNTSINDAAGVDVAGVAVKHSTGQKVRAVWLLTQRGHACPRNDDAVE